MKIDNKMLDHLSMLAKIELTSEDKKTLKKDLSEILDFVEQLNELKTDGVLQTSQVTGLENVLRSDEANYDYAREDMLPTMPDVDDEGQLRVHAVFTDDSPSH
ncbi:MAG: Asp-tRNA(Asn)/Glu-tRNA(Gln) amidotransferase subunit GatC [Candidatus Kerfeldbacteria bacterium]